MIDDQKMVQLFANFQSIRRQTTDSLSKQILRPGYKLPSCVRGFRAWRFIEMARGYNRSLLEATNRFLIDIHHGDSWFKAVQQLEDDDRIIVFWEFGEPHLELAIGRPYSLKNLFIFAAAHLLHQSNFLEIPNWKDDLPLDCKINYEVLQEVGGNWSAFPDFNKKIERLNDEVFTVATGDFRNKSQHRYKIRFDHGLTPVVERTKTGTGISYNLGFILPLDVEKLVPLLYEQHQRAKDVFLAYWNLVNELCAAWDKKYSQN
jgi:hypothetical protein